MEPVWIPVEAVTEKRYVTVLKMVYTTATVLAGFPTLMLGGAG